MASTTPFDPEWADTTVLSGDVAAAIGELKAKAGGSLQLHGSGVLVRWLLDNDLVDEINLLTYPRGDRPGHAQVSDTGPDKALELVGSRATSKRSDDPGLPAQRAPAVRDSRLTECSCHFSATFRTSDLQLYRKRDQRICAEHGS